MKHGWTLMHCRFSCCSWCACQISPHGGSVIFIIRLLCGCVVCVWIQYFVWPLWYKYSNFCLCWNRWMCFFVNCLWCEVVSVLYKQMLDFYSLSKCSVFWKLSQDGTVRVTIEQLFQCSNTAHDHHIIQMFPPDENLNLKPPQEKNPTPQMAGERNVQPLIWRQLHGKAWWWTRFTVQLFISLTQNTIAW